ncbi:NADP-dependent oxidoreductase [Streptomyces sp. CNQ085]|uniref:MDR family NADP-dependent oxidoreductase n=1 Tax=Streptomyces sp. CNQ085 TaxID=2886944 RepID=UPI001F508B3F|nr:NADP-dependent oxidoreductase [Streptomyces sp. CNQ085]MCI0383429.1 NADP-dependent oxidoreductase [Streptomyces sp. CNQ085]
MSNAVLPDVLPATSLEVRLAAYPDPEGEVTLDHFALGESQLSEPGEGQVVVRNDWMTLGSVARDQMNPATKLPIPVFQPGVAMWGRTVGTVVRSASPDLAVGDLVEHFSGWRQYATGSAREFFRRDRGLLPGPEYFLSQGPTAWHGMVDTVGVGEGETVFVSGATNGVGALAGQIAKLRGAKRVIGSTGSREKIDFLVKEIGFDAAFDYHDGPVAEQLAELAPDGLDVVFDNVGGEQFEAAVRLANRGARFALCGALGGQHGGDGGSPRLPLMTAISRDLSFRGFATLHTPDQIDGWNERFGTWLREGRIIFPHTVVDGGVEALPQAFVDLLGRRYSGTVLVKLS